MRDIIDWVLMPPCNCATLYHYLTSRQRGREICSGLVCQHSEASNMNASLLRLSHVRLGRQEALDMESRALLIPTMQGNHR